MTQCEMFDSPDIELYFYGELDPVGCARIDAHLRECADCRRRLEDLHAIRHALSARPVVDTPPAGDWSGFMRRLDSAVGMGSPRSAGVVAVRDRRVWSIRQVAAFAAMAAVVVLGVFMAARVRHASPVPGVASNADHSRPVPPAPAEPRARGGERALREVTAEHLERSKLVVLGLATLDPKQTRAADWQYERQLAGTLLSDTRLYRMAAQDSGMSDVAHVMRDLETVLIETSMSDSSDRGALARVQRLIAKRDLVVKMQLVAAN